MKIHPLMLALALTGPLSGLAQSSDTADHSAHHAQPAGKQALLSEGEVRRVSPETGKVTLRHGPLTNLDMPGMTMVFTATDPKLLDGLKVGDKVRFNADKKDGTYVVTAIEVVQTASGQ